MDEETKIERIKRHFKERKDLYVGIGIGIGITGITCLIMRGRYASVPRVLDTAEKSVFVRPLRDNIAQRGMGEGNAQRGLTNTVSFIFKSPQTMKITTVLDREGRGHPGWPVRNLETKRVDLSQKAAADFFGINEGILSGHLKGKFEDANGLHFERVNLQAL